MINPQWFELPMSRTNFHGPKDVRAIEVRLYIHATQESDRRDFIHIKYREHAMKGVQFQLLALTNNTDVH